MGASRHLAFLRCSQNWLATGFTFDLLCGPQRQVVATGRRQSRKVSSGASPGRAPGQRTLGIF